MEEDASVCWLPYTWDCGPDASGMSGRTYSDVSATDDTSATEAPLDLVVVLGFGDLCLSFLEKRPSRAMAVGG